MHFDIFSERAGMAIKKPMYLERLEGKISFNFLKYQCELVALWRVSSVASLIIHHHAIK